MTERPASRRSPQFAALFGTAAFLLVLDQLTKAWVAANVPLGGRIAVLGELVQVWHAENAGAAFSLLQNSLPLFLVATVLAIGLIGYLAVSMPSRSIWFFVLLGAVLGGTLGNLVDRLTRAGRVIDFISVGVGDLRWPTFNVADSSLVVGILVLVVVLTLADGRGHADGVTAPVGTAAGPHDKPAGSARG